VQIHSKINCSHLIFGTNSIFRRCVYRRMKLIKRIFGLLRYARNDAKRVGAKRRQIHIVLRVLREGIYSKINCSHLVIGTNCIFRRCVYRRMKLIKRISRLLRYARNDAKRVGAKRRQIHIVLRVLREEIHSKINCSHRIFGTNCTSFSSR
jgi:hypothetical protein